MLGDKKNKSLAGNLFKIKTVIAGTYIIFAVGNLDFCLPPDSLV